MKLSKNMANALGAGTSLTAAKVHYGAEQRVAVSALDGRSQFGLVAPAGMVYIPPSDSDAVVVQTDSGRMCLGIRMSQSLSPMEAGELMIYSQGGASITLKNNGNVIISGKLVINGEEY